MSIIRRQLRAYALGACMTVSLSACLFHHQASTIKTNDPNYGRRWNATLVTPTALAGVAQLQGNATWGPGSGTGASVVKVRITNATQGGVHPWAVHNGNCDGDQGVIGSGDGYPPLHVGSDGTATQTVTLPIVLPTDGQYSVVVLASQENSGTIVACGNFSPPVR
jgi:hypothetical protein